MLFGAEVMIFWGNERLVPGKIYCGYLFVCLFFMHVKNPNTFSAFLQALSPSDSLQGQRLNYIVKVYYCLYLFDVFIPCT